MTATAIQPVADKGYKPLNQSRFFQADHRFNRWAVVAEHGETIDTITKPEYFTHVSKRLRPMDKIEVYAEDMSFYAELLVIDAGSTWAKTFVLRNVSLLKGSPAPASDTDKYIVSYRGLHKKFSVVRKADQEVVKDGFQSKDEANTWLAGHLLALES